MITKVTLELITRLDDEDHMEDMVESLLSPLRDENLVIGYEITNYQEEDIVEEEPTNGGNEELGEIFKY